MSLDLDRFDRAHLRLASSAASQPSPEEKASNTSGDDPEATAVVRDVAIEEEPSIEAEVVVEAEVVAEPAVPSPPGAEPVQELARLAVGVGVRAAVWGLGASFRAGARLAAAASEPDTALVTLYSDVTGGVREYAREFLGVSDLDARVRQLGTLAGSTLGGATGEQTEVDLRARGAELLAQAADVDFDESAHPAYARILTELAPDEGRILRLLVEHGPQPIVDIRAGNLIGLGSQLIAQNLNMLGAQAGLRRRERVPAYLNNLSRLGLIAMSDEPLGGPANYQVLEAQPDVLGTLKETPRSRTIHRTLSLSPFGTDFCDVCLPVSPASG
jgi:hypothetical protein